MDIRIQRIRKELEDMRATTNILIDDLDRVLAVSDQKMKELKGKPESIFLAEQETWFRLSNRITLTTIESICFKLKQIALLICDLWNRPLTPKEREKLEEMYANGNPRYLPTANNLKFTFKMYAYAFGCGYRLNCSGKEWADFLEIVDKRNALTHPKASADLKISPEEHDKAAETFLWFHKVFQELMTACQATRKK